MNAFVIENNINIVGLKEFGIEFAPDSPFSEGALPLTPTSSRGDFCLQTQWLPLCLLIFSDLLLPLTRTTVWCIYQLTQ